MPVKYTSSFRAPTEYERQVEEARRRQMLAEALAQQQYTPGEGNTAPIPRAAPLVKALQGYLTARAGRQAEEAKTAAERAGREEARDYLSAFTPEEVTTPTDMISATPSIKQRFQLQPQQMSNAAIAQGMGVPSFDETTGTVTSTPGAAPTAGPLQFTTGALTPAQRQARILEGMTSANPMVQGMAQAEYNRKPPQGEVKEFGNRLYNVTGTTATPITSGGQILTAPEKPGTPTNIAKLVAERDEMKKQDPTNPNIQLWNEAIKNASQGNVTQVITARDLRKDESALRDEVSTRLKNLQWDDVSNAYQRIATAGENPIGDVSIIYAVAKGNDPTGAVRKEDFESLAKSGSYGARIKALVEDASAGRITPEKRKELKAEAASLYNARRAEVDKLFDDYTAIAQQGGLNPESVLRPFRRTQITDTPQWSADNEAEYQRLLKKRAGK